MTSWRDATLWRDDVFYYTSKKPGVLMRIHLSLTALGMPLPYWHFVLFEQTASKVLEQTGAKCSSLSSEWFLSPRSLSTAVVSALKALPLGRPTSNDVLHHLQVRDQECCPADRAKIACYSQAVCLSIRVITVVKASSVAPRRDCSPSPLFTQAHVNVCMLFRQAIASPSQFSLYCTRGQETES